jgi:hypothetical protein
MNNNDNTITFLLEEKEVINYENEIEKMMEELDNDSEENENNNQFNYNILFGNDEIYYTNEYTIKDLLKICNYYGIEKNVKSSKCKKKDIIETIVYFESLPENVELVEKRNRMWAYIAELLNDNIMKKYLIWN